jgi:TolA-binding protein
MRRLMGMPVVVATALLALGVGEVRAAEATADPRTYEVAVRLFQDGAYDLAEKELAEFIRANPESDRLPEAWLLQAQSQYQQRRYQECLTLLWSRQANAGALADRYQYWIAEALFALGNYAAAAEAYAAVLSGYPDSSRRLEASLGQAYAAFRLNDFRRTADLLRAPDGAFQRSARQVGGSEWVARGHLLLADASLALGDFAGGIEALGRIPETGLPPELSWQRQYLLARLQLGAGLFPAALASVTNLLGQLAPLTNKPVSELKAEVVALQGSLLERSQQPEAAILAYEKNLDPNVSSARRFEAIQQIARLTLGLNRLDEAVVRLEDFLRLNAADPAADALRLALGELRLRQFYALPPDARGAGTNLLQQARAQFSSVITNTGSPLVPRAHLNRGWTSWEEGAAGTNVVRLTECLADFVNAAAQLPPSEEQAVARFKLGDTHAALTNYAAAITNYWWVVTNASAAPGVKEGLAGHALHQIVRAAIELGDLRDAEAALDRILASSATRVFGDRSLLLFGQAVAKAGQPGAARQLYADFSQRFPESPLAAEVRLALARSYQQEGNWTDAVAEYERWATNYPGHPSRPRAEFDRAWGHYHVGNETNALTLFTNFLAQFPKHPLAPWAQHWVADHYFRREQFDLADLNYQKIFQNTNWPVSELTFHARLMAGRAALFRQGYNDARSYFTNLIVDPQCPTNLLPEVYFELGNTLMSEPAPGTTNALTRYSEAVIAFGKIPQLFPESPFAPLAWGQMGNCYLQLASADPRQYDRALEVYTNVLASPLADVTARTTAEIGIATVCEKRAASAVGADKTSLLNEALRHYLYVVEGRQLRPNETAEPILAKEAALAGARLAEDQGRWDVAEGLYRRLMESLPPMRVICEARLQRLAQLRAQAPSARE